MQICGAFFLRVRRVRTRSLKSLQKTSIKKPNAYIVLNVHLKEMYVLLTYTVFLNISVSLAGRNCSLLVWTAMMPNNQAYFLLPLYMASQV